MTSPAPSELIWMSPDLATSSIVSAQTAMLLAGLTPGVRAQQWILMSGLVYSSLMCLTRHEDIAANVVEMVNAILSLAVCLLIESPTASVFLGPRSKLALGMGGLCFFVVAVVLELVQKKKYGA